jgi:S1-C subfamily serine protease
MGWGRFFLIGAAVWLAVIALLMGLAYAGPSEPAPAPRPEWSIAEMNRVIDQTNFIVDGKCSGTLISLTHRLILTNHHCVSDKIGTVTEEVTGSDGAVKQIKREKLDDVPVTQNRYDGFALVGSAQWQTTIVAHDKERDLALVQFRQKDIPFTMAAQLLPEEITLMRGMRTVTVGNPAMLEAAVVRGEISSLTRQVQVAGTRRDYIQMSGGVYGGNSGGALFLDGPGFLIGVPAAGFRDATFIGLAVPIQTIRQFLRQACFASVWDKAADDEACRKAKAGEGAKADKAG